MNTPQKTSKGSVGIESFQGRLRLRLPRQLYSGKQKYLTLGLADTPENRKEAGSRAWTIEKDIQANNFDSTLNKYRPQTYLALVNVEEAPQKALTLAELWDKYTQFKSTQLEKTTILRDYGKIQKRLQKLPTKNFNNAVEIRDYLREAYSAEVAKRTLK